MHPNQTTSKPSIGALPQTTLRRLSLRTSDTQFQDLKDWNYPPSYVDTLPRFEGLRLHYVDIGKRDALRTIICLHGQKTWGYSYRKAISYFLSHSFRVIIPDFYGFGRSDKLINDNDYSFEFHRDSILALIEHLGLEDIYVAGFDWGGWIGASLAIDLPQKISRLILGNMAFYTSKDDVWPGFHLWRTMHNAQSNPEIGKSLKANNDMLSPSELTAYEAPFPTPKFKAAVRRFPNLLPHCNACPISTITAKSMAFLQSGWKGKAACIAGLQDPVFGQKSMTAIQSMISGALPLIKLETSGPLVFERSHAFLPNVLEALK